jgi:hypothetical protein
MLSPLDDAISDCPDDSPVLLYLQMIKRNARRLLKLVNTLLQVKFFFFFLAIIFFFIKPNIKHVIDFKLVFSD